MSTRVLTAQAGDASRRAMFAKMNRSGAFGSPKRKVAITSTGSGVLKHITSGGTQVFLGGGSAKGLSVRGSALRTQIARGLRKARKIPNVSTTVKKMAFHAPRSGGHGSAGVI